jgi:hypothetical protein
MRFASVRDLHGYVRVLEDNGFDLQVAENTGRLISFFDLSLNID